MSKFMKFWLLIICFLFIFLIIFTDRVNAIEIGQVYNSSIGNLVSKTETLNLGSNTFTYAIDEISIGDYNQIRGDLYYSLLKTNSTYTGIVNWNQTCASYNQGWDLEQATIHYADGTFATIDYANWAKYCENWNNSNGSFDLHLDYEPQIVSTNIEVSIKESYGNVFYQCKTTEKGYFECDIPKNKTLNGIRFRFSLSKYGPTNIRFGLFVNHLFKVKTDTQEIISNNNTNTQNIINNQNQNSDREYNYISNTTISNENYTNTQTISDNNTNTQTKSVVMNFWLIPLNFFNSIIASFENTCTQVCIGECGSGHDNAWRFIFPCLDIKGFVGNTIYNTIDAFFAVGMIFAFVKRAKNFFINALMLTNDVASEVSVF